MVGTKDIFSLQVDFNIYAADSEFIGGVVLFSISGVQGHFNNCTFRDNPYVVQAHHCVISITNSTLTQVQQTGITFYIRDCKLFINDSVISDNKPSEDHVFITTEDKCHIRMTRRLYTQNYFNPHFKIIEKSVLEIFDSEIIENNSTSNLLEMRDGKFIVKLSVLKYNFAAFASTILLVNSNSNLYMKESIVAEIVPENNKSPWFTILAKSSDITIRDSQISGTGDTYLFLYMPPFVSGGEHFLHVINSNLTHNTTSTYTSVNGPEVVFEHVLYQVKKITILVVMPGAVFFSECRSVRLSHCNFTSGDIKEPLVVFMAPGSFRVDAPVFTLQSNFMDKGYSILSSDKSFVHKATQNNLIMFDPKYKYYETAYSSGESKSLIYQTKQSSPINNRPFLQPSSSPQCPFYFILF